MNPRVVLVDPHPGGHHPTYLRYFVEALLGLGCQVTTLSPAPEALAVKRAQASSAGEAALHLMYRQIRTSPTRLPHKVRSIDHYLRRWSHAARAIARVRAESGHAPDLVFFCWLDDLLVDPEVSPWNRLLDRLLPYPWAGLYFHPKALRPGPHQKVECAEGWLSARLQSRFLAGLGVLDEELAPIVQDNLGAKPVAVFPDLADGSAPDLTSPLAREIRERGAGRRVVSLLGSLEKRKGVLRFLDLAERLADQPYLLVLAGVVIESTFSVQERRRLEALAAHPPANVIVRFGRISDEGALNGVISESQLLWAVYEGFRHSSNILTKAAMFQRPVLVADGYLMAERVRSFRLGGVVAADDLEQLEAAVHQWAAPLGPDADRLRGWAAYRSEHGTDRLRSAFAELLRSIR